MKVISRIAIVTVALGIVAVSSAGAACLLPVQFNQVNSGGFYSYIRVAGAQIFDTAGMDGSYWAVGFGSPTPVVGSDNGTWSSTNWIHPGGLGSYVGGFWGDDLSIDGCINDPPVTQPGKMAVAITRQQGGQTFARVACITKVSNGNYQFGELGDIDLKLIPKPIIASSSHPPADSTQVTVGLAPVVLAGLTQTDAGCSAANLVTGYKLYTKTIARAALAPTDRSITAGGWTAVAGINQTSTVLNCPTNSDVYLATSLLLDSGFETAVVSGNSTVVECGPTVAERPDFRIVPRPGRKAGTTRH